MNIEKIKIEQSLLIYGNIGHDYEMQVGFKQEAWSPKSRSKKTETRLRVLLSECVGLLSECVVSLVSGVGVRGCRDGGIGEDRGHWCRRRD